MEKREASVIQEKDEGEGKLKKISTLISRAGLIKGLAAAAVMLAVFSMNTFNSLAAEGKVTAVVNIRKEASTDSEVVGSTTEGKTIDILEAVRDSSGTVWYKVSIADGGYGYIRSDFVETSGTIEVSGGTSSSTASGTGSTSKPAETVPTSIGERQAVIKSDKSVNVRSGASTQHDLVTALPNGTAITLIGEATDSSGNKWYQITCDYNGRTVEGYVRSDLIGDAESTGGESTEPTDGNTEGEGSEQEGTEGEAQEGTPEESGEDMVPPEPVEEHNDYEVAYVQNEQGEGDYVLYDYTTNTQLPISRLKSLLAVVGSAEEANQLKSQIQNEKIIIIILAVVIVILFIVLTVFLFKLRDLSYDYEEEEEEEEEEEPVPVKKRARKRVEEEEEEEPMPVKRKKPASSKGEERPVKAAKSQTKVRGEKELYAAEVKEPVKKTAARKPQNFLIDDDEFEFEFLNMDDKDL